MRKKTSILPLILLALLSGCSGNGNGNGSTPSVRTVKTVHVERTGTGSTSVYSGMVKEANSINVGFKTAGQIEHINVKEGDYVRSGQLLASLDDSDYKLGVEALQIQYDQVSDEVSRLEELYGKRSVSANDYEKAKAGLAQLGIQLRINKNKLAYTKLYAPVSGYITSVNFAPSEMVDAGTPLFVMMDVSRMEVVADIPASDYQARADFRSFSCRSSQGDTAPLTLVSIAPKADGNQLYRMTLRYSGTQNAMATSFLPGTNVEVVIGREDSVESAESALVLPVAAVRYDGSRAYVWTVAEDSTLVRKDVSVRASETAYKVNVVGIGQGTEVVCAGAATLSQGEKVKIMGRQPESNVGGLL